MSTDRREGISEPKPKMVNPFREPDNDGRRKVATMVADIFRSKSHIAPNVVADGSQKNAWNQVIDSGFTSERATLGVARMQELLDRATQIPHPRTKTETREVAALEFMDPDTKNLLLDLFSVDSRIAADSDDERLQSVFCQLALDLFGPSGFFTSKVPVPEKDRVMSMELFFTHKPLSSAIEFFMIEPDLLPQVPDKNPDEK
ncbi:hypothetical protein KBC14_01700 [Candidatus Woesebacteria bacterium]|jgi:hypothetical protein|nr:hypothetical protein [Candidatus Woesebacteria bacterium]